VASGGNFLNVSRIVTDAVKAKTPEESISFGNHEDIVTACKESDTPGAVRLRSIAKKLRGND
jgi:hypothetical protein